MRTLTLSLTSLHIEWLRGSMFTAEVVDPEDFEITDWIAPDTVYGLAVVNIDKGFSLRGCRELRIKKVSTPVIGIKVRDDNWSENRAIFLENGGDDLLPSDVGQREFIASLQSVTRRLTGANMSIYKFSIKNWDLKINITLQRVSVSGRELYFTLTEYKILAILANGNGRVVSKEQIHDRAYAMTANDEEIPEIKIIDVIICKIRSKLDDVEEGAGALIQTVWGRGYRLAGGKNESDT